MSEWLNTTIGDFCPFSYGKSLPERRRTVGDIPVISSAGVTGAHNVALIESGGIIIGRKGTVGNITLSQAPFWPIDTAFYIMDEPKKRDLKYTYYLLQTVGLADMNSDSAVPGLNRDRAHFAEFKVPKQIEKQQSIAEILSSLDEKIELNRKQNRTLEAIAEALFKRWYLEFEFPDQNGKPYKSSGGVMQSSELGEIPAGWRIGKLEEIISELETGSRPKGGVGQFTEGVPSIGAESITRIGEFNYAKTKYVPEEYFARMRRGIIKDRDVLIYKDGGTPGRFDIRISMFGGGFPYETACINEHVFRLQAKNPIYQNYLYLWFTSYLILEELRYRGAKAAIPGINSTDVKELDFLFIDEEVLEKFNVVIEPLFLKLLHNSREMAILSKLRDTLLPKLMSGELRVA